MEKKLKSPTAIEQEQENERIAMFLDMMGEYLPAIPDPVMAKILSQSGLQTSDVRVLRTLNIACQKFFTEVLDSCVSYSNQRAQADLPKGSNKKTTEILVSDIKKALETKDIKIYRPEYFVSDPQEVESH